MKKILKKFPLTSYATIVVLMAFFLIEDKPRDEVMLIDPALWITILALPLTAINQLPIAFGIGNQTLFWLFPIFLSLLLDLLLFHLLPKLITNLKSKPKQTSKK